VHWPSEVDERHRGERGQRGGALAGGLHTEERNGERGGGSGDDRWLQRVSRRRKKGGGPGPCAAPRGGRSKGAQPATTGVGRPAPT
jgi:hypothetical protein